MSVDYSSIKKEVSSLEKISKKDKRHIVVVLFPEKFSAENKRRY